MQCDDKYGLYRKTTFICNVFPYTFVSKNTTFLEKGYDPIFFLINHLLPFFLTLVIPQVFQDQTLSTLSNLFSKLYVDKNTRIL